MTKLPKAKSHGPSVMLEIPRGVAYQESGQLSDLCLVPDFLSVRSLDKMNVLKVKDDAVRAVGRLKMPCVLV
jgi:hypothetical protein